MKINLPYTGIIPVTGGRGQEEEYDRGLDRLYTFDIYHLYITSGGLSFPAWVFINTGLAKGFSEWL